MRALEWARLVNEDRALTRSDRLMAYALAAHSRGGETSISVASWNRLSDWTGLSRSSVHRALLRLHTQGWLVWFKQRDYRGRQAANLFVLTQPTPVDNPADEQQPTPPGSHQRDGGGLTSGTLLPHTRVPPVGPPKGIEGSSKVTAPQARPVDDVIDAVAQAKKLR